MNHLGKGDNLTGNFLIAMPSHRAGYFNQSVTYICEHNENGCFGIVINQKSDLTTKNILPIKNKKAEQTLNNEAPIFIGGPVAQNRGFILHTNTGDWKSSLQVDDEIILTSSDDILYAILNNQGPNKNLIALGYAGWVAGQLEKEIVSNVWLHCKAQQQIIFDTPIEQRWTKAGELIGVDLNLLSPVAGHA